MRIGFSATIIAALLLPVLLTRCAPTWTQDWAGDRTVPVRFTFADAKARSVCVAGSFNQWSCESHCMRRGGGTWSITIPLSAGRYEYGFMIDGETWVPDPEGLLSEDGGFGRTNSVLIVE